MPHEKSCKVSMRIPLARLAWNFKHLLDFKTPNPFKVQDGKYRPAWRDLHHSLMEVPVRFAEFCPYTAGHVWAYQTLITYAAIFVLVALL